MADAFDSIFDQLTPEQKTQLHIFRRSNSLLNGLYEHPEHGYPTKKALKDIDPTLAIESIDIAEKYAAPINERLTAQEERIKKQDELIAKFQQDREDEKQLGDLQKRLDAGAKKHRLTADGVKAAVDRMRETGSSDVEAAMAWVVSEIEPERPSTGTNFEPANANVLGIQGDDADADRALLHNNPDKWQAKEFNKIMDEFAHGEAA